MVEPERTPVSVGELQAAISRAYQRVTGRSPSPTLIRSLTAQASVETGRGQAMYNFNFGGIKGAGPGGQSASCLTHEVIAGQDVTVHQNFRAYASLDQGAEDYVKLIVGKFGAALQPAASGDLGAFAHALKQAGYYTASESDYTSALTSASSGLGGAPNTSAAEILPTPGLASLPSSADVARLFDALSRSALKIGDPSPQE
jgi:hypothetical protein